MGITGGKARGQQIGILLGYSRFFGWVVLLLVITSEIGFPIQQLFVCFSSLLRLLFSTTEHIVRYNLSCLYWYEFTSV